MLNKNDDFKTNKFMQITSSDSLSPTDLLWAVQNFISAKRDRGRERLIVY